jgi:hypothetical protein
MKISTTHKRFADRLRGQPALKYPEYFLGPNWKDVLNFWIYLDTLSDDDIRLIDMRYFALWDLNTLRNLAWKAAKDTIGVYYAEASILTPTYAGTYVTSELIGSHKLKSLKFLPLFLNL